MKLQIFERYKLIQNLVENIQEYMDSNETTEIPVVFQNDLLDAVKSFDDKLEGTAWYIDILAGEIEYWKNAKKMSNDQIQRRVKLQSFMKEACNTAIRELGNPNPKSTNPDSRFYETENQKFESRHTTGFEVTDITAVSPDYTKVTLTLEVSGNTWEMEGRHVKEILSKIEGGLTIHTEISELGKRAILTALKNKEEVPGIMKTESSHFRKGKLLTPKIEKGGKSCQKQKQNHNIW